MRAFLLSLLWLVAGPALAQEKLVGTNMDVRTILELQGGRRRDPEAVAAGL